MTQFYYGATVDEALLMAGSGAIMSPIMTERAWLQELKANEKEYYEELLKGKTIDEAAQELARTNSANKEHIDQILFTHSVSHSLLRLAKLKEPKVVLGMNLHQPPALFLPLPGPVYLENQLTDVRLYEEAVERKQEIMDAFKQYTKTFYIVRKK